MSWARIMAPLAGAEGDADVLAAASALAGPFEAELLGVYTPPDIADVMPWVGDTLVGGMQATAVASLKDANAEGERAATASMNACAYGRKTFITLETPVRSGLAAESRLSDVVVFDGDASRGLGPLADPFQQILIDEQRPVLIARDGFKPGGVVAVAWDGGKEATRAARVALPLLEKSSRVVIIGAPRATDRQFDPTRLQAFFGARGIAADLRMIPEATTPKALLEAANAEGAEVLVAGAFGHTRLREFIFGGATRAFLNSERPSLFLSH